MKPTVAVVIPCYKVTAHIARVITAIGPEADVIFVVDDKCPDQSGRFVEQNVTDPRVRVLYHEVNGGVGAAMVTGFRAALEAGAQMVVKIDGDGQMDPRLIPRFLLPLRSGEADYVKGNRFNTLSSVRDMPGVRAFGNTALSFLTKLSSGYWSIFDPTNGYIAVHAAALRMIPLHRLAKRFFFESDMLIKLSDARAVVLDMPIVATYEDEVSNLRPGKVLLPFLWKHLYAYLRRVVYSYFLRDFNLASLSLLFGLPLFVFGGIFGGLAWERSVVSGVVATTGTVMVAVLPIVLGFQLIMFFFSYDIGNEPRRPLQRLFVNGGPW
jgi:dolichol-phosphate mannosyltransferase